MRLILAIVVLTFAAGCAAPAGHDAGTSQQPLTGTATVSISDSAFHPEEIFVKKGTILRFQNEDDVIHAPQTAAWTLQTQPHTTSEASADTVGDFEIFCAYHGIKTPLKLHVVA